MLKLKKKDRQDTKTPIPLLIDEQYPFKKKHLLNTNLYIACSSKIVTIFLTILTKNNIHTNKKLFMYFYKCKYQKKLNICIKCNGE